jgi:TolB protein
VYIAEYVSRTNTDIFEYSIPADPYQAKDPSMLRLRKLTSRPSIETEPAVSPDGKQLAYISDRTGKPQIYLMDLGSKKVSRLTHQGAYNTSPAWSPDGSFIAFSARRSGGTAIFRINVATGAESQVTPFDIEAEDPTWSPDGSMIAFTGIEGMASKIYYSLSSGGGYQRLTTSGAGVYESKPAWGGFLR